MALRRQSGSQTIEFAMVILPLMMVFLVGFEVVRLMWVTMIFESAVSSAMRNARTMTPSSFVEEQISDQIAKFPLLTAGNIQIDIPRYADSVASLASGDLISSHQATIAEYKIRYHFHFLLAPRLSEAFPSMTTLSRTVMVSYDA
ncbi:pilus assembly protein [Vibrio pectenicida]|uniref:Pilus assembly protein n=1 Tax=Vibrio pectenicida TaxID=62763 RepID=A0A7Y4EEN5_9VIBR|nr:TadE family protein [Vibrio pectenicida]NOH71553.1 pilus assembly protein [Vibrio pectenicida]